MKHDLVAARGASVGTERRRKSTAVFGLVILASLLALMVPACGSSTKSAPPSTSCSLKSSDCTPPFVCSFGSCRTECHTSGDCGKDEACVGDGIYAVCVDRNAACNAQEDCTTPLACATDYRCRNLCSSDAQCNVLGIRGRVCAKDQNGVLFCAEPSETTGDGADATITAPPPATHGSDPVAPPVLSAGGSSGTGGTGGTTSSSAGGSAGEMMDAAGESNGGAQSSAGESSVGGAAASGGTHAGGSPAAGGASAGASTGGGSASGGSSGASASCSPDCLQSQVCVNGACQHCGGKDQVCCEQKACDANLLCTGAGAGTCACGDANQACCDGTDCNAGLTCSGGSAPICECGHAGKACCPAAQGGAKSCATADLQCAGVNCSCVAEVGAATSIQTATSVLAARRVDGTVWTSSASNPYQKILRASGALKVSALVLSSGYIDPIGCGLDGGAVWCFPGLGALTDSTNLGAGLGAVPTSTAVQVVTSASLTPPALTGVVQISGGQFFVSSVGSYSPHFCAVTTAGSIWCWGANGGYLATGDSTTTSYARRAKASANAADYFGNAVEVRLGANTGCARKGDGTVWCWGANGNGQLGTGAAGSDSAYPVKVPLPRPAIRLGANPWKTQCAILDDTSVSCWGYNGGDAGHAAGTAGAATGNIAGPTTVLLEAGGQPLLGVLDVTADYGSYAMCATTTAHGLVCWGHAAVAADNPYPAPVYEKGTATPISTVSTPLASNTYSANLVYLNSAGLVTLGAGASPLAVQPPCD